MVAATVCIGFVSMSVWAHHMFTVGMNSYWKQFFRDHHNDCRHTNWNKDFQLDRDDVGRQDSVQIAHAFLHRFPVPISDRGSDRNHAVAAPFNWQLSASYFVIAHFHYMIVGGIVFAIFGAFYYWFPKISGRMFDETLAKWHFWLFFIGFHLTFDFMHIPGILGMPRRIYTYEPGRGWEGWNLIVTIGVFFQIAAVLVFVFNLMRSLIKGQPAESDPWDAWTLEWSVSSPPPEYNFAKIPTVLSRRPLWDLKHPEDPDWKFE